MTVPVLLLLLLLLLPPQAEDSYVHSLVSNKLALSKDRLCAVFRRKGENGNLLVERSAFMEGMGMLKLQVGLRWTQEGGCGIGLGFRV